MNRTWAQKARRRGRIGMVFSNICFVLAALFLVAGIALCVATRDPMNLITILLSGVIGTDALSIRLSSKDMLRSADRVGY